jgi:hypothetical protein
MSNEQPTVKLTPEEHKARHEHLHHCMDELFADYIEQHPDEHQFTQMPLIKLIQWSFEQTKNPTEKKPI